MSRFGKPLAGGFQLHTTLVSLSSLHVRPVGAGGAVARGGAVEAPPVTVKPTVLLLLLLQPPTLTLTQSSNQP